MRVECATQSWGLVIEGDGDVQASVPVTLSVPVYTAAVGGSEISTPTTNADGEIPGFIEVGTHSLTARGETKTIQAVGAIDPDAVASVEDLMTGAPYTGTISASTSVMALIAEFPLRILSASLVISLPSGGLPADSETNYWLVQLRRYSAGVATVIAEKSNKLTGGQAIPYRDSWKFDTVAWDEDNAVLQAGDAVDFAWFKAGTPAVNAQNILHVVRFEPV